MITSSLFRLRVWSVACLLGLLLPGSALAQPERDTTHRPPALQTGGWGLQYQAQSLNGLLSGFQGSLVSARYHLSNRQALRLGLTIRGTFDDKEESESESTDLVDDAPNEETTMERKIDSGSQIYGLSGQYLYYFQPSSQVFVFAGTGPQFSYDTSSDEITSYPNPKNRDRREITETETTRYSVGVGGTLGVEWFVHSNVSLSAEYPLSIDYVHRHRENTKRFVDEGTTVGIEEQEQTITLDTDRLRFGGQSVRIGVTFSFGP